MLIGIFFWVLLTVWLLFGLYWNWPPIGSAPEVFAGLVAIKLLLFVSIGLLGWKVFGPVLNVKKHLSRIFKRRTNRGKEEK